MRILLRSTIRNILGRPFRSLLLVLSILVSTFVAMLSFDMSGAIDNMVRGLYSSMTGTSDIYFSNPVAVDPTGDFKKYPEANMVFLNSTSSPVDERLEGIYEYVHVRYATVMGADLEAAARMGFVPEGTVLAEDEVIVTESFAKKYGYEVGDEIYLQDVVREEHPYRIVKLMPIGGLLTNKLSMFVSREGLMVLNCGHGLSNRYAYIDVIDDSRISEYVELLKKQFPTADVESIYDNEAVKQAMESITAIFYILFVICFLLVIFVTISISERIVAERMSVIGTFRSFGIGTGGTTLILLLENLLYALVGSVLGCGLYALIRNPLLGLLFSGGEDLLSEFEMKLKFGNISPGVLIGVILGACLVECLCPLREVRRSLKVSIRDIIFDNKETEYKRGKLSLPFGILLMVLAFVCSAFGKTFGLAILSLIFVVVATALLAPSLIKGASKLWMLLFEKMGKAVPRLSAMEMATKKSSVGAFRLCVTTALLATLIYTLSLSFMKLYDVETFDADLILESDEKEDYFAFLKDLDGVSEVEYSFGDLDSLEIGDVHKELIPVIAMPEGGFRMMTAIPDLPDHLDADEVMMDEVIAGELGLQAGDTAEITFRSNTYFPIRRTMRIAGTFMGSYYNNTGQTILLSEATYKELYGRYVSGLFVRTDRVEEVKAAVEKYLGNYVTEVKTKEEYRQDEEKEKSSMKTIFGAMLVVGVGMTFIGVVSNQLIGYEGRRRECAVLYSVAMDRGNLSRMFLMESFLSALTALLAAFILGMCFIKPLGKMLSIISMNIPMIVKPFSILGFQLILLIVFTLVSLFPIRALKKTNISQELKYE